MLLTIIPFVLAARFALNENYEERYRWRHGSESIYDVYVNLSRTEFGEKHCSTIIGELECRVENTESLGCRFQDGTMTSWRADDYSGCQWKRNVTTRDRFFDNEPFEIRFHSRGIENLVVRRTIPRWRLDVIKAVVAQLDNIASELDKGPSRYVTIENSTFGTCVLESEIFLTEDHPIENENENEFDIVSLHSNGSSSTDALSRNGKIIIERIRHPEKCPGRVTYVFGYVSNDDRTERGTFFDMVSSITRTTISRKSFSSLTLSESSIVASDGSTIGHSRQSATLTLKSVHPARADSWTVTNPASTGLYAPSTPVRFFDAIQRVLSLRRKLVSRNRRSLPILLTFSLP